VPETTGDRIGVRKDSTAGDRRMAVFLRPHIMSHLQWSGLGGGALAHAGIRGRRYANSILCPATPIGVGSRVDITSTEVASCAKPSLVPSKRNPHLKSSAPRCEPQLCEIGCAQEVSHV
jgi:hypothetical protein